MGKSPTPHVLPEGLQELLELERAEWPERLAALRASGALLAAEETEEEKKEREEREAKEKEEAEAEGDDEFDKDRAMETIKKQRKAEQAANKRAAEAERKLKEMEDERKSDEEKREEAKATAEREAGEAKAEALRLRVALRKGLTDTQAKRLVGNTEEELEEDADELLASFKPEGEGEDEGKGPRRPTERLRPGAAPGAEAEELDPDKLAEAIPRQ
jgi:hypothetical protein